MVYRIFYKILTLFVVFENSDLNTPPIFLLNGLTEIGKSTIEQMVAESTDERGSIILVASFFFLAQMAHLPFLSWNCPHSPSTWPPGTFPSEFYASH